MSVRAGPGEKVGKDKTSSITPPVAAWDSSALHDPDPDKVKTALNAMFIGKDYYDAARTVKDEAERWAKRFKENYGKDDDDQVQANGQPNGHPPLDPQIHYYTVCAQNNIDIPTAQEALIRANGDHMVALTLLPPMSQAEAIKKMNPPEDEESEEKPF